MPGSSFEYRRPDEASFWEVWCQRIFAHVFGLADVQRFKTSGYQQHGIDLLAVPDDGRPAIAIQCKKYNSGKELTQSEAQSHIDMVKGLNVPIGALIFALTSEKNNLQEWAAA